MIVPSVERYRAPLETVFGSLGIPYGIEATVRFPLTPLGHALLSLLRFAWGGGGRRELYSFLRSPYSGIGRTGVDFVEGRLRGRAIDAPGRVEEETERLREAPLVALRELRDAPSPLDGVRALAGSMVRSAYGLDAPPTGDHARLDLRSFARGHPAARRARLARAGRWRARAGGAARGSRTARCPGAAVRRARPRRRSRPASGADTPLRHRLRARARGGHPPAARLGLAVPRRRPAPASSAPGSSGPDPVSRDRYLFYTACTRAIPAPLPRPPGSDRRGLAVEESPFWQDAAAVFAPEDVERATRRRALSELTWPVETAPTERERLRAARPALRRPGRSRRSRWRSRTRTAGRRRLGRALTALRAATRPSRTRSCCEQLGGRTVFGATELERFLDCSSAWLFERVIDPKTIDAESDALLRGKIAHQALYAFYCGPPEGARRRARDAGDARAGDRVPRALPRRRARLGRAARARDVEAAELRECAPPRPRAVRAGGGRVEARASCRGGSRSASAPTAPRPSCSAGSSSATASS